MLISSILSSELIAQPRPQSEIAMHSQGNLQLTLSSSGGFGFTNYEAGIYIPFYDPFTGDSVLGCTIPRGSGFVYPGGALDIGAVVGEDTLVSNFWELFNLSGNGDHFQARTIDPTKSYYSTSAYSELDLNTVYCDTFVEIPRFPTIGWDERLHIPLGLEIRQRSMAWSTPLIDDFVLFNFEVVNIGRKHLQDIWVAMNTSNGVHHFSNPNSNEDLIGTLRRFQADVNCPAQLTFNLAYCIDNDGDPVGGQFTSRSPRSAVGIFLLGTSSPQTRINFNWWHGANNLNYSWGPRQRGTLDEPFRSIGPFPGQPYKDVNLYYVMRKPEFDYDQMFSAADHSSDG